MAELQPNMVKLGDVEIWRNRYYQDWHQPAAFKIGLFDRDCFTEDCPYQIHESDKSFTDPNARPLIEKIQSGQRMLVLTDYCDRNEVDYVTFDRHHVMSDEYEVLYMREKSTDCYVLRPPENQRNGYQMQIHWNSLRYAALVDNPDIQAFGKPGQKPLFKRELTRLSGSSLKEVNHAITDLITLIIPLISR